MEVDCKLVNTVVFGCFLWSAIQLHYICLTTCGVHKGPRLVVVVHHNHSHLRAKTSRAQVALTHMKNKLENALETNSNLQISNLAQVQTWSWGSGGFNRQLVRFILINFFNKYIWSINWEPKEEECVSLKQMLPLWKDKATNSEPEKDNCVCEARKRLMTSDCGWTGMRRYQNVKRVASNPVLS